MGRKKTAFLFFAPNHVEFSKIGNVPSVLFFGMDLFAQDADIDLQIQCKRNTLLMLLFKPFEQYFIRRTKIGFRLDQVLIHLFQFRNQDVIFAETDSCGLPLLLLKRLGFIRARVGFNSAGLINNLELQTKTHLFSFYKWLLRAADFIICWSPLEEKMFKDLTGAKAQFVLLEADICFYQPDFSTQTEDFILCVGNDLGRDFSTVFEAVKELDVRVIVVTKSSRIEGLSIPKNIELHLEFVDYQTLLDWYRKARFVVVGLQEIHRFTGQRALLEAMAMGKAVIASKILALTSTYALEDKKNVIYYEPENAEDLRKIIVEMFDKRDLLSQIGCSARNFVEQIPAHSYYNGLRELVLRK